MVAWLLAPTGASDRPQRMQKLAPLLLDAAQPGHSGDSSASHGGTRSRVVGRAVGASWTGRAPGYRPAARWTWSPICLTGEPGGGGAGERRRGTQREVRLGSDGQRRFWAGSRVAIDAGFGVAALDGRPGPTAMRSRTRLAGRGRSRNAVRSACRRSLERIAGRAGRRSSERWCGARDDIPIAARLPRTRTMGTVRPIRTDRISSNMDDR